MIFLKAARYLKYILLSMNRKGHGIHSPFIFHLVSEVFRNKIDPDIVCSIEKVRKKMFSDQRSIIIEDLCSGSEFLKTDLRKVSYLARNSHLPVKYGVFLSNMAAEFGEALIIEFGTSLGISTLYMASSCTGATVKTFEVSPAVADIAIGNFNGEGRKNIEVYTGSNDKVLSDILKSNITPGLIFIGGIHPKEAIINYFSKVTEIADSKTVIIIENIYGSRGAEEAWNEIKQFKRVSVTVDIFRMGIVFFREGINHHNYIIRY
jgi:predicted O-methyltransferase YrrM